MGKITFVPVGGLANQPYACSGFGGNAGRKDEK